MSGSEIVDQQGENKLKPETLVDWVAWLLLWPVITIAWLVAIPFVLIYVAIGFALERAFGIRLPRRRDSDTANPSG